jgi:pyridoxine 5'-phosphate synthase PdxJ
MEKAKQLLAEQQAKKQGTGSNMTVSLYTSTVSGKTEVVVQTNAQTLDLFVSGLADAMVASLESMTPDRRLELISSMLRNAFPVGFAIAGYKAERVTEARVLVCGAAAPAESSLLAHSRA